MVVMGPHAGDWLKQRIEAMLPCAMLAFEFEYASVKDWCKP
jgi:hypothetical protein